jgi:hypothetical protein
MIIARTKPANGADPADPAYDWGLIDRVVTIARVYKVKILFSIYGTPRWASKYHALNRLPARMDYLQKFAYAAATRYSGTYDPTLNKSVPGDPNDLPRVSFWELWNEPNFGMDLAPQAIRGSTVPAAPAMYRSLLDASWSALHATGHGRDTIVIGNLDARGQSARPGRGGSRPSSRRRRAFERSAASVTSTLKRHSSHGSQARGGIATSASARYHSAHTVSSASAR